MKHFKAFSGFYIPYFVFLLVLGSLLINYQKAELHLLLSSFYTNFGDFFFQHFTHVGASIPFVVGVVLLFYKYKAAILVVGSQIVAGLVTLMAKNIFQAPRPTLYFEQNHPGIELHRIEGVDLYLVNSFPSGHTTAAFALCLSLSFLTKNKALQFAYLIVAALAGYSRIYLSQHFSMDVFVGSMVGVSMTILTYYTIQRILPVWGERSLRDLFYNKNNSTI